MWSTAWTAAGTPLFQTYTIDCQIKCNIGARGGWAPSHLGQGSTKKTSSPTILAATQGAIIERLDSPTLASPNPSPSGDPVATALWVRVGPAVPFNESRRDNHIVVLCSPASRLLAVARTLSGFGLDAGSAQD